MTTDREISDSEVALRLCVTCGTDYWGLGLPDRQCHACRRKLYQGRPATGPWGQGAKKERT